MGKGTQSVLLIIILLIAAVLRFSYLDWDAYNHYHPDERFITWVATTIEWPEDLMSAFDPQESTFNPYYWPPNASSEGIVVEQDTPRRFAYGHFPLYLGVAATRLMEVVGPVLSPLMPEKWLLTQDILNQANWTEFRHLTVTSRALTGLVDLASIVVLFLIGRILYGPTAGLLAAALLAVSVLHIQLAHFFTADPFVTFFVLLTLLFLISAVHESDRPKHALAYLLLAGAAVGLAVGSKFNAILLFLPLIIASILQAQWTWQKRIMVVLLAAVIALVIFFVTNPFAIIDATCVLDSSVRIGPIRVPAILARSCYLQNLVLQGTMVRGTRDVPFVRQYLGTVPFLYFIEMQIWWGLGPILGIASFGGFIWGIWRALQNGLAWLQRRRIASEQAVEKESGVSRYEFTSGEYILAAWTVPFFLTTGALDVKFMRYLQPLVPCLILYGSAMILSIRHPVLRRVLVSGVTVLTGLYALAFVNLYSHEHPWIAASKWIYKNIEEGSMIVSEAWDDPLPDNLLGINERRANDLFEMDSVDWLSGTESNDSPDKLSDNLAILAQADYVVLASNRNYGVIPRLPGRYPLSSEYYQHLFDGQLGFQVVYVGTRLPGWSGLHLIPDSFSWPGLTPPREVSDYLADQGGLSWGRFDESFTVYDQPLVIIFENLENLTAAEMEALFDRS